MSKPYTVADLRRELAFVPDDVLVFYRDPNFGGRLKGYSDPDEQMLEYAVHEKELWIGFPIVEDCEGRTS